MRPEGGGGRGVKKQGARGLTGGGGGWRDGWIDVRTNNPRILGFVSCHHDLSRFRKKILRAADENGVRMGSLFYVYHRRTNEMVEITAVCAWRGQGERACVVGACGRVKQ